MAPHESLFSTDMIRTLVDHFWDRYYKSVIIFCFIPFLIYMIASIVYITNYGVHGVPKEELSDFSAELVLRFLVFVGTVYFVFFELRGMWRDGFAYFTAINNYVDMFSLALNIYIIDSAVEGKNEERENMQQICALAVILMWFKSFYWLKLFGPTSFYIRLISETLWHIKYFLILFVLILATFGNAVLILSEDREEKLYNEYFSISFFNVLLNQYELSLGEFSTDNFIKASDGGDTVAWIVFGGATMITQITFLNMLIAIMGDTFDKVTESREQSALVEKIRILADYVYVVRKESQARGTLSRFVFAIRPKAMGADESASWEGTTTIIQNSI